MADRECARALRDEVEHILADDDLIKGALNARFDHETATDLCARFDKLRFALSASPPPSGEYARGLEDAAKECAVRVTAEQIMRDQRRKAGDKEMSTAHADRAQAFREAGDAIRALLTSHATEPPR